MQNEPNFNNEPRTMNYKQFSNEPNFAQDTPSIKYPESIIEQKMSNEPNLHGGKITHLINEQQTMPALSSVEGNNKQLSNEPNLTPKINVTSVMTKYCNNEQRTMNSEQLSNEPNFTLHTTDKPVTLLSLDCSSNIRYHIQL